jgi:hypothetical protein
MSDMPELADAPGHRMGRKEPHPDRDQLRAKREAWHEHDDAMILDAGRVYGIAVHDFGADDPRTLVAARRLLEFAAKSGLWTRTGDAANDARVEAWRAERVRGLGAGG